MLEEDEWAKLADSPGGPAWVGIQPQMEERLGNDYNNLVGIAQRLNERLLKFAANLSLDPDNRFKVRPSH